jgi:hypothetical protein
MGAEFPTKNAGTTFTVIGNTFEWIALFLLVAIFFIKTYRMKGRKNAASTVDTV